MPMVQVGADEGTPVELYFQSHGRGAPVVLRKVSGVGVAQGAGGPLRAQSRAPRAEHPRSIMTRAPTLVIHGDSGAIVPFDVSGKRSHEMIAGARLALIAGGPHAFNVTHAAEFNAEVLDFLRR